MGAPSSFGVLRTRSVIVGGASLLPINAFGPSWAPVELPSVKQLGSWCVEVDEDVGASCRGVIADLNVIGVGFWYLDFNSNGATGAGVEELAPSKIGVELPILSWGKGL